MLVKLIKNDMKSAWRVVSKIYFAAFAVMGVMLLALFTRLSVAKTLSSIALIAVSFVAIVITAITVFGEFDKVMFGDRGYLTNTLPADSMSIVFSKFVNSMLWIVASYVFLSINIIFVYYYYSDNSRGSFLSSLMETLPDLADLGLPSMGIFKKLIALFVLKALLWTAGFVILTFFALTLSNTNYLQKYGTLGSIVTVIAVFIILNYAGGLFAKFCAVAVLVPPDGGLSFAISNEAVMDMKALGGGAVSFAKTYFFLIAAFLSYIASIELLDKKINLK